MIDCILPSDCSLNPWAPFWPDIQQFHRLPVALVNPLDHKATVSENKSSEQRSDHRPSLKTSASSHNDFSCYIHQTIICVTNWKVSYISTVKKVANQYLPILYGLEDPVAVIQYHIEYERRFNGMVNWEGIASGSGDPWELSQVKYTASQADKTIATLLCGTLMIKDVKSQKPWSQAVT